MMLIYFLLGLLIFHLLCGTISYLLMRHYERITKNEKWTKTDRLFCLLISFCFGLFSLAVTIKVIIDSISNNIDESEESSW